LHRVGIEQPFERCDVLDKYAAVDNPSMEEKADREVSEQDEEGNNNDKTEISTEIFPLEEKLTVIIEVPTPAQSSQEKQLCRLCLQNHFTNFPSLCEFSFLNFNV
jgi:hypothetical protein